MNQQSGFFVGWTRKAVLYFIWSFFPHLSPSKHFFFKYQLFTLCCITLFRLTLTLFHPLFSHSFIVKAKPSPLSSIFKMTMQPWIMAECNNLRHSLRHTCFYSNTPNVAMNFHYMIYDYLIAHRKTVPAVQ